MRGPRRLASGVLPVRGATLPMPDAGRHSHLPSPEGCESAVERDVRPGLGTQNAPGERREIQVPLAFLLFLRIARSFLGRFTFPWSGAFGKSKGAVEKCQTTDL